MPEPYHALVWMDHQQAKIFHFGVSGADREVVRSSHPHQHLHHKANARDSGYARLDTHFLQQVAQALVPAEAVLITHIQQTHPDLATRVAGVESLDHPTDRQLQALARAFFEKDVRMRVHRVST